MTSSAEIKVTTEVLWRGALLFVIIDAVFVPVLIRLVKPAEFLKMKWRLASTMGIFFCALFGIVASTIFWDSVYSYVFPLWSRWIIPPVYGLLFASYGLLVWKISTKLPANSIFNFILFGGLWGIITHIWAVYRGIVEKPPMLQGASPIAAVVIAAFEFIFYWCVCISLAYIAQQYGKIRR